jgi:hypothetical protein
MSAVCGGAGVACCMGTWHRGACRGGAANGERRWRGGEGGGLLRGWMAWAARRFFVLPFFALPVARQGAGRDRTCILALGTSLVLGRPGWWLDLLPGCCRLLSDEGMRFAAWWVHQLGRPPCSCSATKCVHQLPPTPTHLHKHARTDML